MEKLTRILVAVDHPESGAAALDKAVTLARQFDAQVELLVLQPMSGTAFMPDSPALGYAQLSVRTVPLAGKPVCEVLLREVQDRRPDLLIKAPAAAHPLRRWALMANDWQLSQRCPVPLMLATTKPWAAAPRLAAPIDVSDASQVETARAVLHTAGFLALGCHGNLDILYAEREQDDDFVRMERAVRLAQLVREYHVGCERLQMFEGTPDKRLPPLFAARHYDLLLLGSVSHRRSLGESIRPLTTRLAEATTGDILLVNGRPDQPPHRPVETLSEPQQVMHQGQQFI